MAKQKPNSSERVANNKGRKYNVSVHFLNICLTFGMSKESGIYVLAHEKLQ